MQEQMTKSLKEKYLKKSKRESPDDIFIRIQHELMKIYGYIPPSHFGNSRREAQVNLVAEWDSKEIPIKGTITWHEEGLNLSMIFNLLDEIQEDYDNERKAYDKAKNKAKKRVR